MIPCVCDAGGQVHYHIKSVMMHCFVFLSADIKWNAAFKHITTGIFPHHLVRSSSSSASSFKKEAGRTMPVEREVFGAHPRWENPANTYYAT